MRIDGCEEEGGEEMKEKRMKKYFIKELIDLLFLFLSLFFIPAHKE